MLRSYRARFLLVHIGDPSSNQATTLESHMIHMIQELFGQTLKPVEVHLNPAVLLIDEHHRLGCEALPPSAGEAAGIMSEIAYYRRDNCAPRLRSVEMWDRATFAHC